jgi:hypothetical protein
MNSRRFNCPEEPKKRFRPGSNDSICAQGEDEAAPLHPVFFRHYAFQISSILAGYGPDLM